MLNRFFCVLLVLLGATAAFGQSESINGTIRGRITDPTGNAVAGAAISAVNQATQFTRNVASGEDGYYVIPTLPLGTYTVTITKDGFSTARFTDVVLRAGTQAVMDATLQVGAVATTVEVTGGAPVVDPARTNISRTITSVETEALPLVSRNPYNWIMFQPGVSGHPNPELGIPRTLNTNGFVDRINYQMDGMANTEKDRTGLRLFPISDIYVSEIQTISNSFAPEFGNTMGDIYNVITGSGTNQLHGMFQWLRGPVDANARPFLLNAAQPKPNLLLNSYAFNAGGPIKKDKLFIYGAYEHLYRALPVAITVSPANQAALGALGVPASQFGTAPAVQHVQFLNLRTDWDVNDKNRVFLRLNLFRNDYPFNTAVGGLNSLSAEADFRDRAYIAGAQWVSTISPEWLNEFRVSYPYRNERHLPGAFTGPGPAVTISGVANINGSTSTGDVFDEKIPSFNDNVTYVHGTHTWKAGMGFERIVDVQQGDAFTQYTFPSIAAYQAALAGTAPKGYSTVAALLGNTRFGYISNFVDLFVQDAWQVRPSLLVTYGIRYDRYLSPDAASNAPFALSQHFNNPGADFSPRLGLAWRLGSKTVLRASTGVFYDPPPTNLWYNVLYNDGSGRAFNVSLGPGAAGAPAYPQLLTAATVPQPQSIFTLTPGFKNAHAFTTSLQLSRQLSQNDALTLGYVNTAGRQLLFLHNVNLIPTGFLADGRPTFSSAVSAATRVNPAFNNITMEDVGAISSYNALIVTYEHRFSHGVQFHGSYTWSHTISDAPDVLGFEQNTVYLEDPMNRSRDRGNSYINRPDSFTSSLIWQPVAKTGNQVVKRLVNDNEFALLTNISSGDEQNVVANRTLNGDGTVAASVTRPLFIGRNAARGPKIAQFDIRYTRTFFTIKERIKPQFFVEANNLFNRRNITSLNTTVSVNADGSLVAPLPSSFPFSSSVLQQRVLNFGLVARW